jgi:hypothetical protein
MLNVGQCEPLKAAVHGIMLATVAVCAVYNAAAWLKRRQRHLAINAVIYGAAVLWERKHVMHHLAECTLPEPVLVAHVEEAQVSIAVQGARDAA